MRCSGCGCEPLIISLEVTQFCSGVIEDDGFTVVEIDDEHLESVSCADCGADCRKVLLGWERQ